MPHQRKKNKGGVFINTPIHDFLIEYEKSNPVRLHMPGHKGVDFTGFEKYDITEICGADSLFEAEGIIARSEENASGLFGCFTFYSTEGSSLSIRSMLYLATRGIKNPLILAGRNAHKTFLTASALVGFDVKWIYPTDGESYLACNVTSSDIEREILSQTEKPTAVYLTSPDYLGNILDIKSISEVCRKYGVLLLVDNAHGGYLKFLSPSLHPIDLGADMCCDSAHKTLPTLTGGGYLHISEGFAEKNLLCCNAINSEKRRYISRIVKEGMSIFASTSPSYLILHSLDLTNKYLTKLPEMLSLYIPKVEQFKKYLLEKGFSLVGKEPLKVTVSGKKFGYSGVYLGKLLEKNNIFPEFYDDDFLVLMFTPQTDCFDELKTIFGSLSLNSVESGVDNSDSGECGEYKHPQRAMTPREALLSKKELIDVRNAKGRILASPSVGCPPAVPIAVCGELIDEETVNRFLKYGVEAVFVVCK